ncbi:MAG: hypothetical protein WC548_04695 [Candidatus Pacearchaeota archaeon]
MSMISNFLSTMLLPFLLTFVVVFAVLQKSKVLGDGKSQIDAMVAFVIGLILIGFPQPREIVVGLMPWIAVGVSVILVFMILYGFVAGDLSKAPDWMKITFGILAGIFTLGVVLGVTGLGSTIINYFNGTGNSDIWMALVMLILIVGAAIIVMRGSKGKEKKEK